MSKYAENNLTRGEAIEIKAKFSFLSAIGQILWCILMIAVAIWVAKVLSDKPEFSNPNTEALYESGLLFESDVESGIKQAKLILITLILLIGVVPLISRLLILWCANLVITNKRVLGKVGVLKIHALDYPIEKVDNISMKAGFWGNIFHYSTVEIKGPGGEANGIKFRGVKNARDFKNHLTEAIERHAEEARKAQAEEIARAMRG